MAVVSADDFLKNLKKTYKSGLKKCKQEIVDSVEPIVEDITLKTRPDTGRSRAEIGTAFVREMKPSNSMIPFLIDIDIYNYWKNEDRNEYTYTSIIKDEYGNGQMKISFDLKDEALYAQAVLGAKPSKIHPRNKKYSLSDFPEYHIDLVIDNVNSGAIDSNMKNKIKENQEKIGRKLLEGLVE